MCMSLWRSEFSAKFISQLFSTLCFIYDDDDDVDDNVVKACTLVPQ